PNRPAEALFSPPTRAMPTSAKNIAAPRTTIRFILESSKKPNRYRKPENQVAVCCFASLSTAARAKRDLAYPARTTHLRPADPCLRKALRVAKDVAITQARPLG